MRFFLQKWDFFVALAISIGMGFGLSYGVWQSVCTELITFFGIQAAAVLPSMIFAAGLLRPIGANVQQLQKYKKALSKQSKFWVSLLALDFISVIILIIGKAFSWDINASITIHNFSLSVSQFANSFTAFFIILTCLRMIPMIQGILSLQKLNAEMVESSMIAEHKSSQKNPLEPYSKPEKFGRINEE